MSESRFTSQAPSAEDPLNTQTVGLVHLSDYRKRQADALERSEKDALEGTRRPMGSQGVQRDGTPDERSSTPQPQVKKKRKAGKGKLSFAVEDDDDDTSRTEPVTKRTKAKASPKDASHLQESKIAAQNDEQDGDLPVIKRRLGPNTSIANAPRILTKSAMVKEAQAREELRKQFVAIQEVVKATEIAVPFVFYDGTNVPGGSARVKKGDHIWVFLDKCRKLGAELAVGGSGEARNRREWARVGVDDLMLVRGELIIPHHYEFYYFIVNKPLGYDGKPIFSYSAEPPEGSKLEEESKKPEDLSSYNPLSRPGKDSVKPPEPPLSSLEGSGDDPNLTKVVNRQWFERNKHIFPASTWTEFDAKKDYTNSMRRDAQGNTYFFPR